MCHRHFSQTLMFKKKLVTLKNIIQIFHDMKTMLRMLQFVLFYMVHTLWHLFQMKGERNVKSLVINPKQWDCQEAEYDIK